MKTINLIKAFRINENTVKVLYLHNDRKQELVVEWNNINPGSGEIEDYDLQIDCLSNSENLNQIVKAAIKAGESEDNPDLDLYLNLRDTFDRADCESLN